MVCIYSIDKEYMLCYIPQMVIHLFTYRTRWIKIDNDHTTSGEIWDNTSPHV